MNYQQVTVPVRGQSQPVSGPEMFAICFCGSLLALAAYLIVRNLFRCN